MSNFNTDRVVHARVKALLGPDLEIARYDRQGKYYLEPVDGSKRKRLTLAEVVKIITTQYRDGTSVTFYENRYGGQALAAAVRRREASKR